MQDYLDSPQSEADQAFWLEYTDKLEQVCPVELPRGRVYELAFTASVGP